MSQYGDYVKRPALISKQDMVIYRLYIRDLNLPSRLSGDAKFTELLVDTLGFASFRVRVLVYRLFRNAIRKLLKRL